MIDATPSHAVLREFSDNSSLTWGLMACGVAQLSKLFLELLLHLLSSRWLVLGPIFSLKSFLIHPDKLGEL